MTYAKMSRSIISPVNAVACSQKESWRAQSIAAMHTGANVAELASRGAVGTPRPTKVVEVGRGVPTAPSSNTERARRATTSAAQIAANRFSANGSQAADRQRNGKS